MVFSCILISQDVTAELFNSKHKKPTEDSEPTLVPDPISDVKKTPEKQEVFVEGVALSHMNNMASYCVSDWEKESCLKELSSVSMSMATNYASKLDAANKKDAMETLKQHCAASTAALKISVPAYAMKSALTECINNVFDISAATLIKPDLTLYQLMTSSVMCLGKEPSCKNIEERLLSIKAQIGSDSSSN